MQNQCNSLITSDTLLKTTLTWEWGELEHLKFFLNHTYIACGSRIFSLDDA